MKLAITGGTGFIGRHFADRFDPRDVVLISRRTGTDIEDVDALGRAFKGCEVVAHFAGINREIGDQTFQKVHVDGTANVIEAAKRAGARKIIMLSFLRARPDCHSGYHESKWAAEELIRNSGLDYTILKAGMIYGHGDHLVDHLSRTAFTFHILPSVGLREKPIRPIPVSELVNIAFAAANGRMPNATVAVTGAESLMLSEAFHRIGRVLGKRVWTIPTPVWMVRVAAQIFEWTMKMPLVAKSQVKMLAEGVVDVAPYGDEVPSDLALTAQFDEKEIRRVLPAPGGFKWSDLRFVK